MMEWKNLGLVDDEQWKGVSKMQNVRKSAHANVTCVVLIGLDMPPISQRHECRCSCICSCGGGCGAADLEVREPKKKSCAAQNLWLVLRMKCKIN